MTSLQSPTVGPDGEIYVVLHGTPSDTLAQLAYDGTVVWSSTLQDKLAGPFLASDGIWVANRDFVYHYTYAHEQDTLTIPNAMGAGGGKLIGVYDNRLYFKAGDGNNELWCLGKEGNTIYHDSTIGVLRGLAVDSHNNAYTTSLMGISKFNSNGTVAWRYQYAPMSTPDSDNPYGVGYEMGPWIGKDGRILFAMHVNTHHDSPMLMLYNQDGTEEKRFSKSFDALPRAVCIDYDGNYYIADNDGALVKYNSDLEVQWTRSITGEVHDMIIDGTPTIYLSTGVGGGFNAYNIHSFDLDGELRWNHIPEDVECLSTNTGWLRVVNEHELCLLTSIGRVYIMKSPALGFTPSEPGTLQPKISGVSGTLREP